MRQRSRSFFIPLAVTLLITITLSLSILADPLVKDPDAETELQRNREINEAIAASLSFGRLKSPGMAFFLSAIIPGTGQFYSKAKRGAIFTTAEITFWTAYIIIHRQAEDREEDYTDFVDQHIVFEKDSPASSTKSWTLEDYEHATQSDNWHYVYTETNGKPVESVGKFYWDDLPEDMIDQPGDQKVSRSRAEAFQKRMSANDKFKQAKAFLGLVMINHVISAIDGRIAAMSYNKRLPNASAEISFHPIIFSSGHPGAYLTVYRRF